MTHYYKNVSLFLTIFFVVSTANLQGVVDDIAGDVGGAKTGSLTISGGASGGVFDSTNTVITQTFNFLSLPLTTATKGQIIIGNEPVLHTFGANDNLFVGSFAGNFSTTAANSTACGYAALSSLTSGNFNTAVGHGALINLTEGGSNIAIGAGAGSNLVEGAVNILIGTNAGSAYSDAETNNIIIGPNPGVADEIDTIRIGGGQHHVACYIDGIYGAEVNSDTGLPVFVDDVGKLGTIINLFQENIHNMGNDSSPILKLRPISSYIKHDKAKVKRFGLLPEEVSKVMPSLVIKDNKGTPYAVKYHELPVLLLNELKKMKDSLEQLEERVEKMADHIEKLEARLQT